MEKYLERNLKRGLENIASVVREIAVSIDDIPKGMDILKKIFSNDNVDEIDASEKPIKIIQKLLEYKYIQPRNLTCRDYMRKIKGKSLKKRIFIHQNR